MTTAYTSLLGLALPVTGELSGTWGDTVNDYITQYLDASVAGTQTISGSQTAVTLSKTTNASLSQAGSGATGSSQYNVINCTGNPASMLTVTVPAASKTYVVVNATSTNQDVKIVGAGPTTGVTLVAGERAIIAWNGSDFIKVATSTADGVTTLSFGSTGLTPSTATSGAVTVAGTLVAANGGTGQSSYTTGDLLYATGSTALSKLGIGTNGQILTSTGTAPQWSTLSGVAVTTFSAGTTGFTPSSATSGAVTLAGTLATTNGGTGLTSFTANGVVYASSSSALTTGSALSFDGTATLTLGGSATNSTFKHAATNGRLIISGDSGTNAAITLTGSTYATPDTIYYAATTEIWQNTSGSEQMRLTSTGLGIGTSSPATKIDARLSGTSSGAVIQVGNTGSGGFGGLGVSDGGQYPVQMWGSALAFLTGSSIYGSATEAMRLTSTGLGIGTSSPAAKLHVENLGASAAAARFTGSSNTFLVLNTTGSAGSVGAFHQYQRSGTTRFNVGLGPISGGDVFEIGNTSTALVTLDSSGNLGIGTSSPVANTPLTLQAPSGYTDLLWLKSVGTNIDSRINIAPTGTGLAQINNTNGTGISLQISGSEQMRLDSSGNLGLGVTPSAWSSGKAQEIGNAGSALWGAGAGNIWMFSNIYYNSNYIYASTGNYGSAYQQVSGQHRWWNTATAGTAGGTASLTQAMTLDASGNLFVGTTSYPTGFSTGKVVLRQSSVSAYGVVSFASSGSTQCLYIGHDGTNGYIGTTYGSGSSYTPLVFQTSDIERFRIASNGAWGLAGANYGTSGQVLTSNGSGSAPTWQTVGGGGTPGGSSGQVQYNSSGSFAGSANFFWDNGNARLGIGTSSPTVALDVRVGGVAALFAATNTNNNQIGFSNAANAAVGFYMGSPSQGALQFSDHNGVERMRIDANGTLLINTTARSAFISSSTKLQVNCTGSDYAAYLENTNSTPYGLYIRYGSYAPNGTGSSYIYCDDSSAQRFSVRSNGGVYNYQANDSNLSDRREKTNFAPAKSYLDTICAIPVQTFNYIDQSEDDPGLTLGVVAQDVQAVAPELVQESNWGTKDDPKMRLSIYQTDLQYALMKCIQELKAQNDDLRARVAQLEAK